MTDMAIGEKYAPLGNWLKGHAGDSVKLTFDELNQIIPIPNHAYMNRPSWANLSSPASFCSSWISAGYVVDSISLEEQWVVFRKGEVQSHTHHHMKQLMAGGGIILLGTTLIPLLSGLF